MANSAVLYECDEAYVVWGVEDETITVVGTDFDPSKSKIRGQALEMWLQQNLRPAPWFRFHRFDYHGKPVVILSVRPATEIPVKFDRKAYIRIGSHKTLLDDHPARLKEFFRRVDSATKESSEESLWRQTLIDKMRNVCERELNKR